MNPILSWIYSLKSALFNELNINLIKHEAHSSNLNYLELVVNAAFIDTGGSSGESDLSDCKVSTILANCLSTTVKGYYFLKYRALKKIS